MTEYALRTPLSRESRPGPHFAEIGRERIEERGETDRTPAGVYGGALPYLNGRLKRALDLGLVVLVAPVALVLIGLAALLIKVTSRGPVFFVQERLGRHRMPFPCFKLRTMVEDAEMEAPRWAAEQDPRVTRVGGFLRRTRLDELPQLYNVWRGEMSLVGVRPIRKYFADLLAEYEPQYDLRFLAKPGISGWDQVHNGYPDTLEGQLRKFRYDLYYLRNASVWLDLWILAKTFLVVLGAKGR